VDGPGGLEQLLRVETWYVEGSYIRHNDEQRGVVLGEDYWEWERNLIHRWRDLINPTQETDFVIVSPTPPTASTPTEVHIILYQQLGAFDCPSLVIVHTVIIEDIQELFQIEDAFWGCGQTLFK
jgi:hypothetical protein